MWFSIAKIHTGSPIRDFIWGSKAAGMIVHDDYFYLFTQWCPENRFLCRLPYVEYLKGGYLFISENKECDSKQIRLKLVTFYVVSRL